jgi:hypothetical protein
MAYRFCPGGKPVEGHRSPAGPSRPLRIDLRGRREIERVHRVHMGTAVGFALMPLKKFPAAHERKSMGKQLVDKYAKGATRCLGADGREMTCAPA